MQLTDRVIISNLHTDSQLAFHKKLRLCLRVMRVLMNVGHFEPDPFAEEIK